MPKAKSFLKDTKSRKKSAQQQVIWIIPYPTASLGTSLNHFNLGKHVLIC